MISTSTNKFKVVFRYGLPISKEGLSKNVMCKTG